MRKSSIASNDRVPYLYLVTVFTLTYLGIVYWPGVGFSARYLGWGIGVSLPFILAPSFFSQRSFIYLILYAIIVWLNYLAGDTYFSSTKKVIEGLVTLFIPLSMTYYAVKFRNKRWMRMVFIVSMFVVVWITIATSFFDTQIPGIVRTIHTDLQNGDAELAEYEHFYAFGMSNYLLPHALPALIPIFAISLRRKGVPLKRKILPTTLLLCVMMLLYFSGATGPMMVGIGILVFSLWVKPDKPKRAIASAVVLGIITLPFLFNDDIVLHLLETIDNLIGNQGHFHGKVVAFQDTILMEEASGDVGARQNLYLEDLRAFFNNVLIGTQATGEHSVILGRLGSLGLVGFVPYIMILYELAKMSIKIIPLHYRIYYYIGTIAALLMILAKGIASWEVYFCWFTLLPIGIVLFADTK